MPSKVVDSRPNSEGNVQNARDPDELFRKGARQGKVKPGEDKSNGQDEGEEYNGIGVQREFVSIVINPVPSVSALIRGISLQ